jgi:hypothetical protein
MARTVPRNIGRKGEHLSQCDVCGSMWLRSALRRGRDGLLRCEQDLPGRDALTLSELTAARAAALSQRLGSQSPADGARGDVDSAGDPSSSSSYTGSVARNTVEEVYADGVPTYADPGTRVGLPGF